jgi:hypothetical protein
VVKRSLRCGHAVSEDRPDLVEDPALVDLVSLLHEHTANHFRRGEDVDGNRADVNLHHFAVRPQ